MKWTVTKEYTFDAAHRLVNGYQGKCKNIHGHTWKVKITEEARDLNHFGFVRDFAGFKILKTWIDDNLDHAMIAKEDDHEMVQFLEGSHNKYFTTVQNPTSEHLCEVIFEKAVQLGLRPTKVQIDETCTSEATYEHD